MFYRYAWNRSVVVGIDLLFEDGIVFGSYNHYELLKKTADIFRNETHATLQQLTRAITARF